MQRLVKLEKKVVSPSSGKRFLRKRFLSLGLSLGFNAAITLPFITTGFINTALAKNPQKLESKVLVISSNSSNYSLKAHIWNVSAIAFSPDGQNLISGSFDQTIRIWDIKTRKIKATLDGHDDGVNAVAISPDGKIIVSAGGAAQRDTDKKIKLWGVAE
jgi:WD40 repeat protein